MKWVLEADDFGNIFHTTYPDGVEHRRPINVSDDVRSEPEFIRNAARDTWTNEIVDAARERRARREVEIEEARIRAETDHQAALEAEQKRFDDAVAAAVERLAKKA